MEIVQLHPLLPRQRQRIEQFLATASLRLDDVDYYAAVIDEMGHIVAGGGLQGDIIKCVAVADGHQGETLANTIVSHLIAHANADGYPCVKLYTKPNNRALFESLSFRLLAEAPQAILMETGIGGISRYCDRLRAIAHKNTIAAADTTHSDNPPTGVVVMNANPFTLGHRYLVEQAASTVETLYVIVVREDCSAFAYSERKDMVTKGLAHLPNVVVTDGSRYAVSKTTFPTYFLKQLSDASDTQMTLDLDLYRRHIAPALGASVRFVGSEPADPLTHRYNELMKAMLPNTREIARLETNGMPVTATRVRKALVQNRFADAAKMVPQTTTPYIIAHLATRALRTELNTTPKPGLVDSRNNGAHSDMDHALMMRAIRALQPYFVKLALMGHNDQLPPHYQVVTVGIEAENAMLQATQGVNTHKGALFALGLAVVATARLTFMSNMQKAQNRKATSCFTNPYTFLSQTIAELAAPFDASTTTHGAQAKRRSGTTVRLKGALDNAREGYAQLFNNWLPFYASCRMANDTYANHRTLLRIMTDLDDTNIVHRASTNAMTWVKHAAQHLLQDFSEDGLEALNRKFVNQNLSPGGSADMLALVIFLYGVTRKQ